MDLFTFRNFALFIVSMFILTFISTSVYMVQADEVGVVLRFGKYVQTTGPGLHFRVPFGVDDVDTVAIKKVFKEEFGFRTKEPGVRTQYDTDGNYHAESLHLTGDLNAADVEWVVQYQISDPYVYLFVVRDPVRALRDLSEAVMRTVVGDATVTEVLTIGRVEIVVRVRERLQMLLDRYDTGLTLVNVVLQDVNPPDAVKPSYNNVNAAKQEKDRLINEARKSYNESVPREKGIARQRILEAEGYALERINRARGDAHRFIVIQGEYAGAKAVTRRRLYLETISMVLPNVREVYVVDQDVRGILPLLQLNK